MPAGCFFQQSSDIRYSSKDIHPNTKPSGFSNSYKRTHKILWASCGWPAACGLWFMWQHFGEWSGISFMEVYYPLLCLEATEAVAISQGGRPGIPNTNSQALALLPYRNRVSWFDRNLLIFLHCTLLLAHSRLNTLQSVRLLRTANIFIWLFLFRSICCCLDYVCVFDPGRIHRDRGFWKCSHIFLLFYSGTWVLAGPEGTWTFSNVVSKGTTFEDTVYMQVS